MFATTELEPFTSGGIGAGLRELTTRLAREGIPCTVLTLLPSAALRALRGAQGSAGVEVLDAGRLVPDGMPLRAFRSEAHWRSYRAWRAVEALHAREPLAAVEFPDFEGLGAMAIQAKRLGVSPGLPTLVVRLHGTGELAADADHRQRFAPEVIQQNRLERYALRHADEIVAPSAPVLDWMSERYRLASRREIAPLPVPVLESVSHARPSAGGPLRLLFFGKLQPLKGAPALVAAVVRCLERREGEGDGRGKTGGRRGGIEVDLVGPDDPFEGRSQADILRGLVPDRFRHRLRFHGELPREAVRQIASRCHAAVFPSRFETFGLAAHEAAALGLPLLVSDIPAFRAAFGTPEGNALFFEPSADGLEALLAELLDGRRALPESTRSAFRFDAGSYRRLSSAVPPPRPPTPGSVASSTNALVSVLVPYHEAHETLDETLRSLLASSHPTWEAIVVDDGSSSAASRRAFDGLVERHAGDERFRFFRQENRGLSGARNAALDLARGRYALPLDADDLIDPELMTRAVRALESNPELGFVSCWASVFEHGRDPRRARDWFVPYDPYLPLLLLENGAGMASCVFRTELLKAHRYDESLEVYEDWDLQIRLALAGVPGEVLPEALFRYRSRSAGLARSRAHPGHDRILADRIEAHFPDADPALREALQIYVAVSAQARGLGPAWRPEEGRLEAAARWLYRLFLRDRLATMLPAARRQALVEQVKRWLRR